MSSIVTGMTTSQIAALTTTQIASLTTKDMIALSTSQIGALTTEQVVALSTAQAAALSTDQVGALTTAQVVALETRDLAALRTAQVAALTTNQIGALTTSQIAALTTTQVEALTSNQVAVLTTTQIQHLALGSPIALDLNGDGVRTLSISAGVRFDLYATGDNTPTGWISPSDGLLVLDHNQDGVINDGSELFGSSTILASGDEATDGYIALRTLDSNGDGSISSADQAWSDLRVWIDGNSDGVSQGGELRTLESLGIAKLNLDAKSTSVKDNGNWVGLISSYEKVDGSTHDMADVWFVAERPDESAHSPSEYTTQDAVPVDLRSRVSGLVQAMAAFDESQSADTGGDGSSTVQMPLGAESAVASLAAPANVARLVDTLRQFDANGNPIAFSLDTVSLGQSCASGQPMIGGAGGQNVAQSAILVTDGK
ncbi:MAG: hypothetical protein ACFCVA_05540 [Gammaproteobacteria bacterium]